MPHPDMNPSWNGGHPDEGLLHEWLDEQLSTADATAMQTHITSCAECQARVAEARGLIAASHRILSALDEVPADVIPANIVAAGDKTTDNDLAGSAGGAKIEAATVTSIDVAGKAQRSPVKRTFRWQPLGKIAAVLLVAVTIAKVGLRGDDVIVPVTAAKKEAAIDSSMTQSQHMAATGQSTTQEREAAAAAPSLEMGARSSAPIADAQAASARVVTAAAADATPAKPKLAMPAQVPAVGFVEQARARAGSAQDNNMLDPNVASRAAEQQKRTASTDGATLETRANAMRRPAPPAANIVAAAPPPAVTESRVRADTIARALATIAAPVSSSSAQRSAFTTATAGANSAVEKPAAPAQVLTGKAAGMQISAPSASPPIAAPPAAVADRVAPRDSAAKTASTIRMRSAAGSTNLNEAVATSAGGALGNRASRAPFDSVTLNRTVCLPTCELTSVHVNAAGDIRFAMGLGNTQRVAMSKLSDSERTSFIALLIRTFPDSSSRTGRTACTVRDRESLELIIDYSANLPARANNRCGQSNDNLRKFGAALDSIARISTLRARVTNKEP